MAQYQIAWSAVTVDDTGAPVTVQSYDIFVDGVFHQNTTIPTTTDIITLNDPGNYGVTVFAVAAAGRGLEASDVVVVNVPSGLPAKVLGVSATQV